MTRSNPCPECGSTDNLITFNDGGEWCFTPNCEHNKNKPTLDIKIAPINSRNLTFETCAKYGVGVRQDNPEVLLFPYFRDGVLIGYQARTPDKKFWFMGDGKKATLFGLQVTKGNRRLIITEGALDALAAYQMTGYDAVAVRSASTAVNDIKANLEYVESFEYVYVCTDMDPQGRKAATDIMSLLKSGKGLLMNLPSGFKDPCDMLKANAAKQFKDCLFAAKPGNVDGAIDNETLIGKAIELFSNETKRRGVSSGSEALDGLLGGLRPGEVTLFVGGTGVGKTAIVRQLAMNLAVDQKQKVFFIPLEMRAEVVLLQMCEMYLKGNVFTDPEFTEEAIVVALGTLTDNIKFFDHFGTLEPTKLLNTIEYVCRTTDSKFVVLDHLSAVVSGGEDERRDVDRTIAGLKELALRIGIHILVVSHISRANTDKDDNEPTLNRVRHSAGIAQYSDQVLGIIRSRDEDKTLIKTLKVSRLWGRYGSCVWQWTKYHFVDLQGKGGHDNRRQQSFFDDDDNKVNLGDSHERNILSDARSTDDVHSPLSDDGVTEDGPITSGLDGATAGLEREQSTNIDVSLQPASDTVEQQLGRASRGRLVSLIKDGKWVSTW